MAACSNQGASQYRPITGYFRDDFTRADLIIVTPHFKKGSKKERQLTQYLTGVIKSGMSVELENGRLPEHKHLIFIKVTGSDELIRKQGNILFYYKPYKERHAEFIKRTRPSRTIPCTIMQHERIYLEMIRENYPGPDLYSTLDRSRIVYDVLMNVKFGTENPMCLPTLMKMGIALDAYALHDGPYFLLKTNMMSSADVIGRSVLFTFWTGLGNILREQPLHIINEYLGERIGFFFAFYGAYICFLICLSVVGLLGLALDEFLVTSPGNWGPVTEEICSYSYIPITWPTMRWTIEYWAEQSSPVNTQYRFNLFICPNCVHFRICPHRILSDFCEEAKWVADLETDIKLYILPFLCFVLAAIFLKSWKRKENYLIWIWEIDAEYVRNMVPSRCCGVHYELDKSIWQRILRLIWELFLLAVCVITSLLMLYYLLQYRYYLMLNYEDVFKEYGKRRYYTMGLLGVVHMLFVYIIDRLWYFIMRIFLAIERFENPDEKDNAEARRVFTASFIYTFTLIAYVAFIKGQYYTTPLDKINLTYLGGLLMENCQLLTCIDEVFLLIFVIVFMKDLVFKFLTYIRFYSHFTDYSCLKNKSPYWERERSLYTDKQTEKFLLRKYKEILMQFATATLFMGIYPLAPLVALITSAIDLRFCARRILLATRRPLIRRATGIGPWWYILVLLVFLIGLCHILIITITSDFVSRTTEELDLEMNNSLDHIHYKTIYRNFTDYTRINGFSGDATNRTRVGHIPLVLFPEYDYWSHPTLSEQHTKYHVEKDGNLKFYRHHYPNRTSTLGCYRIPSLGVWYAFNEAIDGKPSSLDYGVEIVKNFLIDLVGNTCNNTFHYNPIHHCYFRGYYKRFASSDKRAVNASTEWKHISFLELFSYIGYFNLLFQDGLTYKFYHKADLYHVYGYAFGWQHQYEAYMRWWYTTVLTVLMTILLYMIYHCLPDIYYYVTEVSATEKNLSERQSVDPNDPELSKKLGKAMQLISSDKRSADKKGSDKKASDKKSEKKSDKKSERKTSEKRSSEKKSSDKKND